MDKSYGLAFIQHENQNDGTYGCRASTRNVRQSQRKDTELQYLTFYSSHRVTIPYILFEKVFKPVSGFKSRRADKLNQVYFMSLLTFITPTQILQF